MLQKLFLPLILCVCICESLSYAQQKTDQVSQSVAEQPSILKEPENLIPPPHHVWHDFVQGQKNIWTSPMQIRSHDFYWLIPLIGTTAVTLNNDVNITESIEPSDHELNISHNISKIGSGPATFGTAGGLYLLGKLSHHDHLASAGLHSLEALIQSSIVIQALKLASGRERPDTGGSEGEFWHGGTSFPSGHSADIWTIATVFSEEYPHNQWLRWGSYSVATAVAISRVTGERHFVSDVIVGSTIGFLVGRMMVRMHYPSSPDKKSANLMPYFEPKHKAYGMIAAFHW